ncbi:pyridoxamine 5'-phosphate oxidase, partial [Streptomyces sp. WAC 04229]
MRCVPRQLHHIGGLRHVQDPPVSTTLVINTPRP